MKNIRQRSRLLLGILTASLLTTLGCQSGFYPFVVSEWREDEAYTVTAHEQIEELQELRDKVSNLSAAEQYTYLQTLEQLMGRSNNPALAIEIVKTVGKFSVPESHLLLKTALTGGETDIRVAVCDAWAERQDARALDGLVDAFRDAELDVRLAVVRGLGNHKGGKSIAVLAQAIEDANPAIQYRAIRSLETATGEDFGQDLPAWRAYLQRGGFATAAR